MKKLLKILPVVMVVCMVVSSVFALTVPNSAGELTTSNGSTTVNNAAQNIWGTLLLIAQIVSIAAVVFAGIRYMFASADQKADIKKSMGILAVGAILVFGASTILKFVVSATNDIF